MAEQRGGGGSMMVGRGIATSSSDGPAAGSQALACLALVGRMSGLALSAEKIRADHGLPAGEIGFESLALCATRAGFRCKATTLAGPDRDGVGRALPAIVRLTDGRTLVLTRLDDRGDAPQATLVDPTGPGGPEPLVLLRAAFERAWSGEILLLRRSVAAAERDRPLGWALVGDLVRAEPRLLRDVVLATPVLGLLVLGQALLARALVQNVADHNAMATLLFLGSGALVLILFEAVFTAVRQGLLTRLSVRIGLKLDVLAFDRLLGLPLSFFERTPRVQVANALDRAAAVQAWLAGAGARAALDGPVLLILLVGLMAIHLVLAAAVAGLLGLVGLVSLPLMRRQRRAAAALAAVEADGDVLLGETLGRFRTIKTAGLGGRQRRRWDVLTARTARLRLAEASQTRALDMVAHVAERLVVFGTVTLGVALAVTGVHAFAPADLVAVLLITSRMAAPLRDLPNEMRAWSAARDSLATLANVLDGAPESLAGRPGVTAPVVGHIAFAGVTFSYPDAPAPALQSISFEAPEGAMLGIMGRSGAGKSTIARLLQRLNGDYQGLIKLDGIDLREFDLDHLRGSLAVVGQDSPVFPGTLRDNLALGRSDLSPEALLDAVRLVGGEAHVERLPDGLDTVITETATVLSDSLRQRLAIARAVLADPAVLVLDEATTALDPASEAELVAALRRRRPDRTLVVIAQRLAALADADAILVLDRGELQDIGRHQELVERSDLYSGMWRRETAALPASNPAPALGRPEAGPRLDAHVA